MNKSSSSFFTRVVYFFPIQLIFVHIKKNPQLLLFWLILFLTIFKNFGLKYGIPYLFLAPEYLGELSFASYFMVGFALGGFVVAYNISSYIMNGFRFPFLATLSKPFFKYSLNNSLIPSVFLSCYLLITYFFLSENEGFSTLEVFYRLLGFMLGYILFTVSSTIYFLATNKDFEMLFGKDFAKILSSDSGEEPAKVLLKKKEKKWFQSKDEKSWRIDTYLNRKLKVKKTRPYQHYNRNMLSQVFRQNHVNASFFQFTIIASILFLGIFRENEYFIIPAGATIILLFTMLIMFTSALRSWTKGWTFIIIIALLIFVNQITKKDSFYYDSKAYGLNYDVEADYSSSFSFPNPEEVNKDLAATILQLENWKKKTGEEKPKAIFLATSGGGSRAAMWSFLALQHLNNTTQGHLMRNMVMGTGSSGGMIGAAYYREIYWREQKNQLDSFNYQMDMGKDILNPVIFTLAANDVLIRTQRFESGNTNHWKDRGYIFEKILHENTHQHMNKTLGDYYEAENSAEVPTLIFTPSIINDSRRLIIATRPMRFLCQTTHENVDYQTLFSNNSPQQLKFSTALRMTASFPYVMPTVSLPTKPNIEVFDSGLKDNYGMKTTINYIYQLKKWFEKNTSGIVILQVKDGLSKQTTKGSATSQSIISEILSPFGSLYGNWFDVQEYNNNELLSFVNEWYKGDVEVLTYELNKSKNQYISLSWHLTSKEKKQVLSSINTTSNQKVEAVLKEMLSD